MSHIVSVLVCLLVSASSLPVASTSSQTTTTGTTTTGTSMAHMEHHTKNVGSKGTRALERSGGKMRLRHTSVLAMKSSAASAGGKEKKSTQKKAAKLKKRSVKKPQQRADASPLSSKAPAEFRVYSTLPVPCCAPAGGAPAPLTPP